MRLHVSLAAATVMVALWFAAPARAAHFFFSTGNPDSLLGALSRTPGPGGETETADDFVVTQTTVISRATVTGLIVPATPLANITNVEVELYHIFPLDSDTTRTLTVPTRTNSPADVEIAADTRDSSLGTLHVTASLLSGIFTAANSVVNGIFPSPGQHTGGEGPKTGAEVEISITFTPPLILPAGHYFFRPEVGVAGGDFLYLSAPRPIVSPGTPFPTTVPPVTDLQAWIRNTNLKPDWLRIGSDIVGTPAAGPTFNMTFSLTGDTVPQAGTPGQANCHGKTVSALALQFEGMSAASSALGFSSVDALQNGINVFCAP